MTSRFQRVTSQFVAAGVAGALLFGCSGDDDSDSEKNPPSGIVTTKQAREVPLSITRPRFDALIGQEPVQVKKRNAPEREVRLDKLPQKELRRLRGIYGKKRTSGRILTLAPETFTCLLYRGEKPKQFAWQFCFGERGTLEYLATAPPLPA